MSVQAVARTETGRRISSDRNVVIRDAVERKSRCEDASVTEQTLDRACAGDEIAFREMTDPYRRELGAHIYRIVGSTQDAEDLLQETLLAAWRGLDQFEARASLRAWLYRIATNRSLDALRANRRRPEDLQRMTEVPKPSRRSEPIWIEPYPDVLLEGIPDEAPGPEACYETKEALGHPQPRTRRAPSAARHGSRLRRLRGRCAGRGRSIPERPSGWVVAAERRSGRARPERRASGP